MPAEIVVGTPQRVAESTVSLMGGCFRQVLQKAPQGADASSGSRGRTRNGLGGGFCDELLRDADRVRKVG